VDLAPFRDIYPPKHHPLDTPEDRRAYSTCRHVEVTSNKLCWHFGFINIAREREQQYCILMCNLVKGLLLAKTGATDFFLFFHGFDTEMINEKTVIMICAIRTCFLVKLPGRNI